jgi:hypothetical protein
MDKFDPKIDDDNPPMDAAFMAGMKPSQRKTLSQALAPAQPQDFEWEPARSVITALAPDVAKIGVGLVEPFDQKVD